ncbi:glutaredoxin-like protein NrdH [Carnobacteriaceae bacterium zg-ZUI252]|nr:glutaredoxin-like protein NrdH [Carnobacteriaceae bacterium zg-ZUI252]MBS4770221.1 glutaredoxin-like protein NrdH [Carnobacteriaceae bacterium zg-ZUI240]
MSKPVTVYSKPNCMQCNFTKQFLLDNDIDFIVKDVEEDAVALEEVKALGFSSLPVVVIEGEEPFNGFRPDRLEGLL